MKRTSVKIGGAIGFWGEAHHATAQLLTDPDLEVLVYDFLAEITLSIMARARQKDPDQGYAPDFVTAAMAPNLSEIAARNIKVLSNAGGMNPAACATALQAEIARQGLALKVAVVEGDDLKVQMEQIAKAPEMFSGAPYPDPSRVLSVNAYLGAGPMVAALTAGADIVITGRCVDSALTLAACMHRLGWTADQHDLLAAGSLAGHLIECGPQSTGGNFTDWEDVPDPANIGYPIVEVFADGQLEMSKPPATGGLVTRETVGEQMLYEIGDPAAYILPDVICDFTEVTLTQIAADRVEVAGAKGRSPSGLLKVSTTYMDGYRAGQVLNFNGRDARAKGLAYVDAVLRRTRARLHEMGAPDFDQVSVETFGGSNAGTGFEEVSVTAAVRHQDARAVGLFLKELIGNALATPPGLHFFTGAGRPKPSPVVKLFSSLVEASVPDVQVSCDGQGVAYEQGPVAAASPAPEPTVPQTPEPVETTVVCLEQIAVARSGDKGDKANIGVLARTPEVIPWIWMALTPDRIAEVFGQNVKGSIERFYLPGSASMNILVDQALGGGGIASLRNDSQGKAFAQRLLAMPVAIPAHLVPKSTQRAS